MILTTLIQNLKEVPERLDYHPEGNTYTHTLMVVMKAHAMVGDKAVVCAALLHDICKGLEFGGEWKEDPTTPERLFWSNVMHPTQAKELILSNDDIRYWVYSTAGKHNLDLVVDIVANHMKLKTESKKLPKKLRHIPYIDAFRACDDMIGRYDYTPKTYGYRGEYLYARVKFAGFAPVDLFGGCNTYTITFNRHAKRQHIRAILDDIPDYIKEVL